MEQYWVQVWLKPKPDGTCPRRDVGKPAWIEAADAPDAARKAVAEAAKHWEWPEHLVEVVGNIQIVQDFREMPASGLTAFRVRAEGMTPFTLCAPNEAMLRRFYHRLFDNPRMRESTKVDTLIGAEADEARALHEENRLMPNGWKFPGSDKPFSFEPSDDSE